MTHRVLFICTGNICRSAFAESAARFVTEDPDIVFDSAGTHAMEGNPATATMQRAAAELGIDITSHRSKPLRDCVEPDIVLGMEQQHLVAASRRFPNLSPTRIRLLDHPRAIDDPYGLDIDAYKATATHIMDALRTADFR